MSIRNPTLFKGEQSFGTTAGAPLSTDANNQLVSGISTTYLTGSTTVTTSSGTFTTVSGMTTTPVAGTYLVFMTGTFRIVSNGADGNIALFKAGTIVQESNRRQFSTVTIILGLIGTNQQSDGVPMALITVNGSQVIDARFNATSGTIGVDDRSMILVRIS